MRVYIEVSEDQHAQLKEMAGLVPVSRWIRSQLFPVDDAQRAKELIPLLQKSIEKSKKVSKAASGSHSGEAAQGQQAASESPSNSPVDMKRFLP